MSTPDTSLRPSFDSGYSPVGSLRETLLTEYQQFKGSWFWFLAIGILLAVCGTAAVVVPSATVAASFTAVIVLGILLMAAGAATIVGAFWIGRSSGFLFRLLVGVLYIMCGFVIAERPGASTLAMTMIVAVSFIVLGIFRAVGALVLRFPHWGWVLLNGVISLIAGLVIFRHFPESALWVIGLLVGIEMLFHGWSWIILALAIRKLPDAPGRA